MHDEENPADANEESDLKELDIQAACGIIIMLITITYIRIYELMHVNSLIKH